MEEQIPMPASCEHIFCDENGRWQHNFCPRCGKPFHLSELANQIRYLVSDHGLEAVRIEVERLLSLGCVATATPLSQPRRSSSSAR